MSKIIKTVVSLILVITIFAGCDFFGGSDEERIRNTVDQFFNCYNSGDYEGMTDCLSSSQKQILEASMGFMGELIGFDVSDIMPLLFGISAEILPEGGEMLAFEIDSIYIEGDSAEVYGNMGINMADISQDSYAMIKMTKEGGDWKIAYLNPQAPKREDTGVEASVQKKIDSLKETNGKQYTGSGQCKGFARKVFNDLFGSDAVVPSTSDNNYELNDTPNDGVEKVSSSTDMANMSDEEIKDMFSGARPGDIVQMRRDHGGPHTAIVESVTEEGVVWYEANLDGKNGISENTYTWAQLRDGKDGYRINDAMSIYTATDYSLNN